MDKIYYPSKYFLKNTKIAVKNGKGIEIVILSGWRKKMLLPELAFLLNNEIVEGNDGNKNWKYILCMFLELGFFTAYFYAKSANYAASYIDDGELTVILKPPR